MDGRLQEFRGDLTGYCYRMLGCPFEAEDAVQETLVRAWRNFDRYDDCRSPLRSWLYAIATNVCLDMVRGARRRARAMDLCPASRAGTPPGDPLPASAWVHPIPDSRMLPANGDPAEPVAGRETVRLAFIAALQLLPPRQRAVLILRDVLCWTTAEVSGLLNTSVVSVTSALQRARVNLRAAGVTPGGLPAVPAGQRRLLDRYCAAFAEYDVETLVSLLREDATMSMPPFAWWLRGREEIRRALLGAGRPSDGVRLVPTVANGSPAFGQYRAAGPDGGYRPFALVVLELSGDLIRDTTTYLDAERLFPLFGLPAEIPGTGSDEFAVAASHQGKSELRIS
ncbi:sigma-70 family RNA polymerase sigma factor [Rugosimonospora africana]|uniref:DNA-directed RNA polymerase sigma-70 factor n=1 Tax=Rugosimonospora africana TaxID=556532 RepID=A0A8J3QVW0_9ACTN|nr:sigma-70 family RNA polymerase sigma factor [Rugosimonospora africana]GIH17461.1 DNA-directed RNA polymerase sigma-70 factor [Rugosimonospora africana]